MRRAGGASAMWPPNAVTSLCDTTNVTKERQLVLRSCESTNWVETGSNEGIYKVI